MKQLFRHILKDCPKFVRLTALILFSLVMFVGVMLTISMASMSFGRALLNLIYYLLLAAGSALVIIYAWKLYFSLIRKHTLNKLDDYFEQKGYCKEMFDTINAITPAPSPRERALSVFTLVMAEHYEIAEREIAHIDELQQDMRDFAMIMTAKIRLYIMTSRMEKAGRIFENHNGTLEDAYETQPDLLPEYRVYGDDAFEFYMLSAVYSILTNHPEKETQYRKLASFQLSKRSPGESQFYTGLMELNALYARGKTAEAYTMSQELFMLTEQMQFLQAQKNEMRRALEQAKLFASYTRMIADSQRTERKLPVM